MAMYGKVEVQYWQITPIGVQRIQTKTLRGIGTPEKQVLAEIAELGGIAETDELTVGGQISPGVINTSLKRLTDMGLIIPVGPPTAETPG